MKKKSSTKDLSLSRNERLFLNNKSVFAPKNFTKINQMALKFILFMLVSKNNLMIF